MKSLVLLLALAHHAHAQDAALDHAYKNLQHPRIDFLGLADTDQLPAKSDTLALIAKQTPIRNQAARGSCSIFSATALLESMLIVDGKADPSIDLSEEYLQYVISQHTTNDGSTSPANFAALHEFGIPSEQAMPYIGLTWTGLDNPAAQARCGQLKGMPLAHCLTGHRDPRLLLLTDDQIGDSQLVAARKEALANKQAFFTADGEQKSGIVGTTSDIKKLLSQGIPLTLDIDFYFGAWNHRLGPNHGINRDLNNWQHGLVGYPEEGSMDRAHSREEPDGHSIVIVGYDDDREVSYTSKMTDGSMKTFTRKGVYYFKNSWDVNNFGPLTEIDGQVEPGYGVITQDYANEFGQFFQLTL